MLIDKKANTTTTKSESSSFDDERLEILDRLLPLLSHQIDIPNFDRAPLWTQETGTLPVVGATTTTSTTSEPPPSSASFGGNNNLALQFHGASLHWMWQHHRDEDDGTIRTNCCLNFLANHATSTSTVVDKDNDKTTPVIQCDKFQWTLEAISSSKINAPNDEYYDSYDSDEENNNANGNTAVFSLQSFWKIQRLQLLCVEIQDVTLLGTIDDTAANNNENNSSSDKARLVLQPNAFCSFSKVQRCTPFPKTSHQHIALARLVSTLDQLPLLSSGLQWKTPLPHFNATFEEFEQQDSSQQQKRRRRTLGDIFRHIYNYLEDLEMKREKETMKLLQEEHEAASQENNKKEGLLFGLSSPWKKKPPSSTDDAPINDTPHKALPLSAANDFSRTHTTKSSARRTSSTCSDTSSNNNNNNNNRTTASSLRTSMSDSLVGTAALVATGASFVTPIGAVVTVAAVGVKDGVAAAAAKGRSTRNAAANGVSFDDCYDDDITATINNVYDNSKQDDRYRFGDVTRGVVASIRERKAARNGGVGGDTTSSSTPQKTSSFAERLDPESRGRYAGILGSSAGAAAGFALAGPIGMVAGSLGGSIATRRAMRNRANSKNGDEDSGNVAAASMSAAPPSSLSASTPAPAANAEDGLDDDPDAEILRQLGGHRNSTTAAGITSTGGDQAPHQPHIKLRDLAKGVLERGKEASGRDKDAPYRFGDFSRGLFAKK